jgi:hypothetical protein
MESMNGMMLADSALLVLSLHGVGGLQKVENLSKYAMLFSLTCILKEKRTIHEANPF